MTMFVYLFFMLFSFATACDGACDDCVQSKAAYFSSSSTLSSGACGYGSLALNFYGGHIAAALPSIYNHVQDSAGCGACFQIRCKHNDLCSKTGTKIVVTDLHNDKSNTTAFVLSNRAFRAMALSGKDQQVLELGIVDVDYKRYNPLAGTYLNFGHSNISIYGQNLAIHVEEFSNYPNYLAIKILYQGGQTEILTVEVASMNKTQTDWKAMRHNYGAVWDTSNAPIGPLQFRFHIVNGYDGELFFTNQVLPANWKPGLIYNSTVQMDKVEAHACNPCGKWE